MRKHDSNLVRPFIDDVDDKKAIRNNLVSVDANSATFKRIYETVKSHVLCSLVVVWVAFDSGFEGFFLADYGLDDGELVAAEVDL